MLLDWHIERGKTFGKDLHNTQFSEKELAINMEAHRSRK